MKGFAATSPMETLVNSNIICTQHIRNICRKAIQSLDLAVYLPVTRSYQIVSD